MVPTGLVVGHIAPEAQVGGPIAYLQTGDLVTVDQDTKEITMHVSDEEIAKRKAETTLPPLYSRGVLGKYAPHRFFSITWCCDRLLEYGTVW